MHKLGCLNVKGCSEVEKVIGLMFAECRLEILGLSGTKLRWEGGREEFWRC